MEVSGDAFAAPLPEPDFDFELGSLDGLECLDGLDLDEFWDGGVESFLAVPGKEGGLGLDDIGGRGGGRESSPDSVVTDDGAPSSEPSGDRDDGGEMSAYVSELERFLMEDVDECKDREPAAPAEEEHAADEHFFDDLYVAEESYAEAPADAAETAGAEEEEELAVDDYFLDDIYVADDSYAEPEAGAGVEDAEATGAEEEEEEEELAVDEYFFGDFYVADSDYAEPAAGEGVVDPASEEDAAAREDEATSRRKRARYE